MAHEATESPWHTFLDKWTPDKAMAALIIIICGVLMLLGIDSEVKSCFLLAAGWLFGGSYQARQDAKLRQLDKAVQSGAAN